MTLANKLSRVFTSITFIPGEQFAWQPTDQTVIYKDILRAEDEWSLLHELGHALLKHRAFNSDINLLQMEVAAWAKASKLAKKYSTPIDWRHVEQCIDTYRDWLHARSTCPSCQIVSFQINNNEYWCFNCSSSWKVSKSRLCRIHRRQTKLKQLP